MRLLISASPRKRDAERCQCQRWSRRSVFGHSWLDIQLLCVTQRVFACLRHLRDAPYWLQTVTTIGLPPPPLRLPLSVPGMVAVLPGAAGTVPEGLVCVRLNSPPSTVLCQLTAPSWYQ